MRRIKLSIDGILNEWNSKESSISMWEYGVEWYGREELIFLILVLKKFEKILQGGQTDSTLIILRPRNVLHKPNILFKSWLQFSIQFL